MFQSRYHFYQVIIVSVTVLVSAGLLLFGVNAISKVIAVEGLWTSYNRDATKASVAFNKISSQLGYGGFIHNFKNYVLRQDSKFLPKVEADRQEVYKAITAYEMLGLNHRQQKAISELREVLDQYSINLKATISYVSFGMEAKKIDLLVKVNDAPALQALEILRQEELAKSQKIEKETERKLEQTLGFLYLGGFLIPAVISIGFILFLFTRKLLNATLEMEKATQKLDRIIESVPDAMLIVEQDGRISRANDQAETLFGYQCEDLLGRLIEDLVPTQPQQSHIDLREGGEASLSNQTLSPNQVLSALHKTGREVPVEISRSQTGTGKNAVVITTVRDITERLKAEKTIKDSEERYRAFFNSAGVAIVVSLRDGTLSEFNDTWQQHSGYTEEELAWKTIGDLIHADDKGQIQASYDSIFLKEKSSFRQECRFVRKNGQLVWVDLTVVPIVGEGGEVIAAVAISPDITSQKAAHERVKKARLNAEKALEKLEKAQDTLVQSEKLAALGGLVAGVAHEINTPVGISVSSASHLDKETWALKKLYADDELTPEDLEGYLETATQATALLVGNCNRAAELIQSFKQVAVDQTGGERREFALHGYIDEVLLSLRPELKKKKHSIEVSCPDDLVINGLPGVLSQIFTNFIMNSLTHGYNEAETGHLKISAKLMENEMVEMRYSDDGKGIEVENQAKVFDPFFTTARGVGGSGLGLNIIYNLVYGTLNGNLEMESYPGEGTAFILRFPRVQSKDDIKAVPNLVGSQKNREPLNV
ncbi:MAG: PAS domain-containing sensor histidine kinase [Rhodospirillales bacterium]|nr:PAS domain-containing sensor histidine kinase [Rhodospirillales bacterium]